MPIDLASNAPKTPARLANIESMQLAVAGNTERWLDLFSEDAVLQDPYDISPMDPTGSGRVGKEEIANVCEVDDAGEISLLRAYWNFDANLKTAF